MAESHKWQILEMGLGYPDVGGAISGLYPRADGRRLGAIESNVLDDDWSAASNGQGYAVVPGAAACQGCAEYDIHATAGGGDWRRVEAALLTNEDIAFDQ